MFDQKAYDKKYYQEHREYLLANARKYKQTHPETKDRRAYYKSYRQTPDGLYNGVKGNAKGRERSIVTKEEFVTWFAGYSKICHYCSRPLSLSTETDWGARLSVDRKDNNKDYTLDNITLCCYRCNMVKNCWLTEEQMLRVGTILAEGDKHAYL